MCNVLRTHRWSRRDLIAVFLILAIIAIIFSINQQNHVISVTNLNPPSIQKSTTSHTNEDGWIRFAKGVYGYSAYWDSRLGKSHAFLRIISIAETVSTFINLKCLVRINKKEYEGELLYDFINEHHGKKFAALIINCVSRNTGVVPEAVTVFSTSEETGKTWMTIKRIELTAETAKGKMAVCVRPLFGPFNRERSLAQFISYYQAIGFSHFTFYNQSITQNTKSYLAKLSHETSLVLLPWDIPSSINKNVWSNGQLASIQDCIYRHMHLYEYLMIVDVDEYAIPKRYYHLQETINAFVRKEPKKPCGAFIMRNSFFCVDDENFIVLNNTRRMDVIWPAKMKSKVIMKPEAVVVSGIHSVERMFKNWIEVVVPLDQLLLHHYRNGMCNSSDHFDNGNISLVEDKTALRYVSDVLHSRPVQIWEEIFL